MNPLEEIRKGFAGRLAETFLHSRLTPVIAVASLVLGLFAVYLTPKKKNLKFLFQ